MDKNSLGESANPETIDAPKLKRGIGLPGAVMMGLGSILGTGVFVSVAIGVSIAGAWTLLAIALASVTAICNGLSSAQLAAIHPVSGGTYEYGHRWCSPRIGFIAGWMFMSAKSASAAAAALGFSGFLLLLLGVNDQFWLVPVALLAVAAVTTITLIGIRRSSLANSLIVAVTIIALVIFVIAGLPNAWAAVWNEVISVRPSTDGWSHADFSISDLLQVTALMFVAYTGYGRIATLGEEIKNPSRNIPRAIIATLVVSMLLYISVGFVVAFASPRNLSKFEGTAAMHLIASEFNVPGVSIVLAIGAITAMLGVLLNLVLGLSRVLLAMGRRSEMPTQTALISQGPGVPWVATLVVALIIGGIVMVGDIHIAWSFSAFAVLIYYSITNLCVLRMKTSERIFPLWPAWIGLTSCLFLAFWVEPIVWANGLALIAIGLLWQRAAVRLNENKQREV